MAEALALTVAVLALGVAAWVVVKNQPSPERLLLAAMRLHDLIEARAHRRGPNPGMNPVPPAVSSEALPEVPPMPESLFRAWAQQRESTVDHLREGSNDPDAWPDKAVDV